MNEKSNTAITATLRNNKGFTLIEMAIVLVIIGIIIGAVVKGQDLIENAKAKQFASKMKAWDICLSTYYDRKGRLPGDTDKNGLIGNAATDVAAFTDISTARFVSPPEKSFQLGGTQFFVVPGSDATSKKNYILVCKNQTCTGTFSAGDPNDLAALKFFESYDTAIDGSADAKVGAVTGATAVTVTSTGDTGTPVNYKASAVTVGAGDSDWIKTANVAALAYQLK